MNELSNLEIGLIITTVIIAYLGLWFFLNNLITKPGLINYENPPPLLDKNRSIIVWHNPKDRLPERSNEKDISIDVLVRMMDGKVTIGYYYFYTEIWSGILSSDDYFEETSIKVVEWAELPHL